MNFVKPVAILSASLLFLSGCATIQDHPEKGVICPLTGVVAGGAVAAGVSSGGALAPAGALAGGIVADYFCQGEMPAAPVAAVADQDADGVVDGQDQCPATPAGVSVDAKGCELDSDADGIVDSKDQCPATMAGLQVNAMGCKLPVAAAPVAYMVAQKCTQYIQVENNRLVSADPVLFATNSADVSAQGQKILACVADFAKGTNTKLEVGGYTDSVGSKAYNLRLSQRRAGNARAILVAEGLREGQLRVRGYGMANLKGKGDNAQSRRVEVKAR